MKLRPGVFDVLKERIAHNPVQTYSPVAKVDLHVPFDRDGHSGACQKGEPGVNFEGMRRVGLGGGRGERIAEET